MPIIYNMAGVDDGDIALDLKHCESRLELFPLGPWGVARTGMGGGVVQKLQM